MTVETYRMFCYDINTNSLLCEIPFFGLSFDSRLGDSGANSFGINLQSANVRNQIASLLAYDGNPVKTYIDRSGQIVWGGINWTTDYSKSSGIMQFGGKDFISYLDHRVTAANYTSTYDPAALIALAVSDMQSVALSGAGASIGLQVLGGSSALTAITGGYPLSQFTPVSRVISDLVQTSLPGIGGLDVTIGSAWDINGNPVDTLQVWSPRAGRIAGSTGLIFDLDSALDYRWPTDATQAGNYVFGTGAGSGDLKPTVSGPVSGIPVGGLGQPPRLDRVENYNAVTSQSQLNAVVSGLGQQYGQPLRTPIITIPTGGQTPLGSWGMGDDGRLYSGGDERFPNGKDEYWRIVQQSVRVPDEGLAVVDVTFNVPPIY